MRKFYAEVDDRGSPSLVSVESGEFALHAFGIEHKCQKEKRYRLNRPMRDLGEGGQTTINLGEVGSVRIVFRKRSRRISKRLALKFVDYAFHKDFPRGPMSVLPVEVRAKLRDYKQKLRAVIFGIRRQFRQVTETVEVIPLTKGAMIDNPCSKRPVAKAVFTIVQDFCEDAVQSPGRWAIRVVYPKQKAAAKKQVVC